MARDLKICVPAEPQILGMVLREGAPSPRRLFRLRKRSGHKEEQRNMERRQYYKV
jgi:hypothetical protein